MNDPITIDATQAFLKSSAGTALLVCAYADEERCHRLKLAGALTYGEFLSRRSSIPRNHEIIFYETCEHEEISTRRAKQFRYHFASTRALLGGVKAWRQAGHPMAADAPQAVVLHPD